MDGQYMLAGEFVAVVAFLFAPPLLLAIGAQTVFYRSAGMFRRGKILRIVVAYLMTVLLSLALAAAIEAFAPRFLGPILRVRDIWVFGLYLPVFPLAGLAVVVVAPFVAWWVVGRSRTGGA